MILRRMGPLFAIMAGIALVPSSWAVSCSKAYFDKTARLTTSAWVVVTSSEQAFASRVRRDAGKLVLLSAQGRSVDEVKAIYLSHDGPRIARLNAHFRKILQLTSELNAMLAQLTQADERLAEARTRWSEIADTCQQQQLYDGYGKAKNNLVVVHQHIGRTSALRQEIATFSRPFLYEQALLTRARRNLHN